MTPEELSEFESEAITLSAIDRDNPRTKSIL